jgi:hypothetical protein
MATRAPARDATPERELAGDCPRCGSAYAPLQEYCLECGLRLDEDPLAERPRGALAALPAGGAWIWPSLVALVVATIAVAVVLVLRLTDEPAEEYVIATAGPPPFVPTAEETVPEPTLPTLPAAPRRTEPPPRRTPPPARRPGELVSWPAGRNGWTVVLASYPEAAGRETATARAREASEAGVRNVGVLESSEFASLHPGYFVVFAGIHESQDDAESALSEAQARGYEVAYVREIASSR